MASCFFLLKQFEDVNIYLSSVKVGGARIRECVFVFVLETGPQSCVARAAQRCELAARIPTNPYPYSRGAGVHVQRRRLQLELRHRARVRGAGAWQYAFANTVMCISECVQFKEAEETLLLVQNEKHQTECVHPPAMATKPARVHVRACCCDLR